MSLSAVSPQPMQEASFTPLKALVAQVVRLQHGAFQADLDLCAAQISTPGYYDDVQVSIPPGTHFETCVNIEHDAQGQRSLEGWVHFSQPVKACNLINAFVPPENLAWPLRPLANWVTSYQFEGITFGSGRPTLLQGRTRLLGVLGAAWLDRRISQAVATPSGVPLLESRGLRLGLHGLSNLGQASSVPGDFSLVGSGTLPNPVAVNLSDQSFALVPGGPYCLQTGGCFDLRQPGHIALQLQNPANEGGFQSAALGLSLRAQLKLGLEDRGDARLHMSSQGSLQLAVHHLAFDVRAKDMPTSGGIRIVGGDVRTAKPYAPALMAPVDFTYKRGTLNASGLLQLNAGATFVDPCEPPPSFEDDRQACDVKGTLDLSALIPRLGQPLKALMPQQHHLPPDYAIRGVVSVRPPNSDPVYYRMDVTPAGPDFELEPDYTPPPSLLTA